MLEFSLDQFPGIKAFAVNAARPVTGREEPHQVKFTRLERFQPGRVVLVNLDRDALEISAAAAHVQVPGPIRCIAHIGDVTAKFDRADPVRPAADRDIHHHLVERFGLAVLYTPFAAENRQAAYCQRQLAVGLLEAVAHGALIHYVQPRHIFQNVLVGG